jgi:hypothetical protein
VAALAVVVVLAWSWVVTGLAPFSATATVAVLATGLAAMAIGALGGRRRIPVRSVGLRSAWPWLGVAAVLAAWQLAAFVQSPREDHPTISSLTNAALEGRPVRAVAFAGWAVAAAWLVRR